MLFKLTTEDTENTELLILSVPSVISVVKTKTQLVAVESITYRKWRKNHRSYQK